MDAADLQPISVCSYIYPEFFVTYLSEQSSVLKYRKETAAIGGNLKWNSVTNLIY